MQKLDVKIIQKIIDLKATCNEITSLLYFVRYQDKTGQLENLRYSYLCDATGMSKQGFYDALNGLEKKGIVKADHSKTWGYFDITILDNNFDFGDNIEEYKNKPYISTSKYNFLYSKEFIGLSGGAKRLILGILRRLGGYSKARISMKTFRDFAKVITDRSIYKFLKSARQFFDIVKEGKAYVVKITSNTFKDRDRKSEKERSTWFQIRSRMDKMKVKYTDKSLNDTTALYCGNKYFEKYGQIFEDVVNNVCEAKGELIPKLINSTLQFKLEKLNLKKMVSILEPEDETKKKEVKIYPNYNGILLDDDSLTDLDI